ncbi:MAG TPA: DedA family protein [Streptosporangiaceae bacterium]|nr:DedA family protein [Streptosporangiaceae bacterium]
MIALDVLRVDSLLSYLIAILAPALDAILPVIPSETAVITLGVATAGSADPRIALLVLCSAFGAFLGDNLCYLLGRRFSPWIERRFFRSEKGQQRRDWAERSLERYGMPLIIVCRFIPGGRTAVMLSCGIVRYDRRRFVIATAAAGLIWASYSFFIGRLGGKAFEDKPWAGLLLALGLAITVSAIIEAVRRIRSRRAGSRRSTENTQGAEGTLSAEGTQGAESTKGTEDTRDAESAASDRDTRGTQGALRADSDRGTKGALDGRRAQRHEPTGAGTAPSSEPWGSH